MPNSNYYPARINLSILSLLFSGIVCSGSPPSVIAFEEGEQFNVSLSSINFNRVFVEGETIVKLSYPHKSLTVDKSEIEPPAINEGSVYIKPNFEVPITLFITTDKEHHLSLTLTPDESFGKTLRLVAKKQTKTHFVTSDTQDLTEVDEVMASMKAGDTPKDFNVARTISRPFYIKKDIKVTLEKHYQGSRFTGYVYRLENTSNHEVGLTTELFSNREALSLSLSDEQLAPRKVAYLYGLYSNEGKA
ncbi:MAG: type-F conjugative transfer system secretin TraK [Legionella sp.]|nr:type-F conjugative transfer system secretin TraK [Legionella sp.]